MKTLWSPWRSKYIDTFKEEHHDNIDDCFFCEAIKTPEQDAGNLVVTRQKLCFVMLNRYPYNNGHLLVAPYRHISGFEELTKDEMQAVMELLNDSLKVLNKYICPHGFNIGTNIGREAGAGVPGHIHFHVVPRWNGDTSFMPVLADIKIISQAIEDNQKQISLAFKQLYTK